MRGKYSIVKICAAVCVFVLIPMVASLLAQKMWYRCFDIFSVFYQAPYPLYNYPESIPSMIRARTVYNFDIRGGPVAGRMCSPQGSRVAALRAARGDCRLLGVREKRGCDYNIYIHPSAKNFLNFTGRMQCRVSSTILISSCCPIYRAR